MDVMTTTFSNGVEIINVTPHPLSFEDQGELVIAPNSGVIVSADAVETLVSVGEVVALVKTIFIARSDEKEKVNILIAEHPNALIIGSIITAQAFPHKVFGMVPVPGFERRPPEEKRMLTNKFITF